MPGRTPLRADRRAIATDPRPALLIVAPPGSGKTSLAAERFGFQRYSRASDQRRCVSLSFTRAATIELADRIRSRWGPSALAMPHRSRTLDSFYEELLRWLLINGHLAWRTGNVAISVEDSWRGFKGCVWRQAGQYVAVPKIVSGVIQVRSVAHRGQPIVRMGKVSDLRAHFDKDLCTHLEVREILALALADPTLRDVLGAHLQSTTRSILVDEIFDGNDLDAAFLVLAAERGLHVTAIGDPWQAVYEFRGAHPRSMRDALVGAGFERIDVEDSFRYENAELLALVDDLRQGRPCVLPAGRASNCDVVLATKWDLLWDCPADVLPLSFGELKNQTDAAIHLLLDHVLARRLRVRAVGLSNARAYLQPSDSADQSALDDAAASLVAQLRGTNPDFDALLMRWRSDLRSVGFRAQLRRLSAAAESDQQDKLRKLAQRIVTTASVPGMTVHQAKGGEWPAVGVRLDDPERAALAGGLSVGVADHRTLYVAVTRAKVRVTDV